MNITVEITAGMTPQEKEVFFKHQAMRHREDAERVEAEKESLKSYRQRLIEDALKCRPDLDPEDVKRMSIRKLELMS